MKDKIADFHCDILTAMSTPDLKGLSSQTDRCACAIFTGNRSFLQVRAIAEDFFRRGHDNLFLTLEDASYLGCATDDEALGWGPACVSLTWNYENGLAGGCFSETGLTRRGERAVAMLGERGIALDCAHLNIRSFCDVLDFPAEIVNTHTCMYALHPHPRNIKDWQIREIAERGGLVGVTFVGKFLGEGRRSSEDIFRHVDYGVQKFGANLFCFGTDFWGTDDLPAGVSGYACAEELAGLFIKAGYGKPAIKKIFRGNLRNFLMKHKNRRAAAEGRSGFRQNNT